MGSDSFPSGLVILRLFGLSVLEQTFDSVSGNDQSLFFFNGRTGLPFIFFEERYHDSVLFGLLFLGFLVVLCFWEDIIDLSVVSAWEFDR